MTKYIELTKGMTTIVDDDDYERLNQYKWHIMGEGVHLYASRSDRYMLMHRAILGMGSYKKCPLVVDHINHDTLDNRKKNLRVVTVRINLHNQRKGDM